MLKNAKQGATFLLNSPFGKDEVWAQLPKKVQQAIIDKKLKFFVIDGVKLGNEIGLGPRINVIMQTAFFKISNIIPLDQAVREIKDAIVKTYGKAGEKVVNMNNQAVDVALENIQEVSVPATADSTIEMTIGQWAGTPETVQNTLGPIIDGLGEHLPVSAMPVDGTFPTGTAMYEKRNIAVEIPVWDEELCIQCGICSFVCPHATIRMKIYDEKELAGAPADLQVLRGHAARRWTARSSPCRSPSKTAPAAAPASTTARPRARTDESHKAINMQPQPPLRETSGRTSTSSSTCRTPTRPCSTAPRSRAASCCRRCSNSPAPVPAAARLPSSSSARSCSVTACMVANATGCSSIYGGNLPTTPWTKRKDGRGPAWSNSLFEDNAEFGFGMRLAVDKTAEYARELLVKNMACGCAACKGSGELKQAILDADQSTQALIEEQRGRVSKLKAILAKCTHETATQLLADADYLVKKSVWILGGDGWAYDIGYGGLDHVLASGANVNVLVLDTEVYSNTGGQASKATPMAAVAQFAAGGKQMPKKDLAMIAMTYGNIYVAKVSLANPAQVVKALLEADAYDGPSLIIAYSHCIAHGIDMTTAVDGCKEAVNSGYWPLFRFDPRLAAEGKNPLQLDSKAPTISFEDFAGKQNRFRVLKKNNPEQAEQLMEASAKDFAARFDLYQKLAELSADCGKSKQSHRNEKAPGSAAGSFFSAASGLV